MVNTKFFSRIVPVFAGIAIIVAGCDKAQTTPDPEPEPEPEVEEVQHFTLSVENVTYTTGDVSISRDDQTTPYYWAIMKKDSLEKLGEDFQTQATAYLDGEYDFLINDWGFDHDAAIADIQRTQDVKDSTITYLYAAREYVLIAAYVDDEGKAISKFEKFEFSTPTPDPANVTFELKMTDIQKRSASYSITPSNNEDPYACAVLEYSKFEGMTDDEILDSISLNYSYYKYKGSRTSKASQLKAGTEYMLVAYGQISGAPTTKLYKKIFSTVDAGDPAKWSYTASFTEGNIKGYQLKATITPSDDAIDYFYELVPEEYTADRFLKEFSANMEYLIEQSGLTKEMYIKYYGKYGTKSSTFTVVPGTKYKIAAIAVNGKTLEFATAPIFSDTVSLDIPADSDVTIEVKWDKYYSGDSIYEYNNGYEFYKGVCVFPVSISHTGKQMRYGVYVDNGTEYTKQEIVYALINKGSSFVQDCYAPFGKDGVVYAVSIDKDGLCGPVFSKKFNFKESEAGTGADYFKAKGQAPAAPQVKAESASAPVNGFAKLASDGNDAQGAFVPVVENPYRR